MKLIARGCAPTRMELPTSISPKSTSSSLARSERFCARWLRSAQWREIARMAMVAPKKRSNETVRDGGKLMPIALADKRATFRKMHEAGCFVLPNPFDVGSAKALQQLGIKALASTSAGFAWSIGKADNRVTLDEVCAHLAALCAAVD